MSNPYFTNTLDLIPGNRARASDVEANLSAVEAGFDGVKEDMDGKAAQTDYLALLAAVLLRATIDSPTFTGDPKAPTPADGDNDTSLSTTAFVQRAIALAAALNLPSATGADGKVLAVVAGVPTWVFSGLAYSEVSGTTGSAAKGEHKALRNAAATTITGPASAETGDLWAVSVENDRLDNVVAFNGLNHMGISDATMTIDAANVTLFFEYHGATYGWKIY